jgi:hypothetical protein
VGAEFVFVVASLSTSTCLRRPYFPRFRAPSRSISNWDPRPVRTVLEIAMRGPADQSDSAGSATASPTIAVMANRRIYPGRPLVDRTLRRFIRLSSMTVWLYSFWPQSRRFRLCDELVLVSSPRWAAWLRLLAHVP